MLPTEADKLRCVLDCPYPSVSHCGSCEVVRFAPVVGAIVVPHFARLGEEVLFLRPFTIKNASLR